MKAIDATKSHSMTNVSNDRKVWKLNFPSKRIARVTLNRCQQLPAPYKRLILDENETDKQTSNRPN